MSIAQTPPRFPYCRLSHFLASASLGPSSSGRSAFLQSSLWSLSHLCSTGESRLESTRLVAIGTCEEASGRGGEGQGQPAHSVRRWGRVRLTRVRSSQPSQSPLSSLVLPS